MRMGSISKARIRGRVWRLRRRIGWTRSGQRKVLRSVLVWEDWNDGYGMDTFIPGVFAALWSNFDPRGFSFLYI
jgi:hypothetical protein